MTRLVRSVEEFLCDAGIGRTTFYGLVKRGDLVVRKIGRRSVITDADAEAFIRSLPAVGGDKSIGRRKRQRS